MADIKRRIRDGTFDFKKDFPDYRFTEQLPDSSRGREPAQEAKAPLQRQLMLPTERTCDEVFDSFLHYCEMRVAGGDMAFSTLNGYRKILKGSWRPKLGAREFKSVVYSELVKIAASQGWKTKKTYNNGISPLRCAFAFEYKDHPEKPNPAEGLDSFRITKKDRPKIDPFTIHEAERLIRELHVEWGEPIGNYDEFRFFTGLRQSEEIALRTLDCNLEKATIEIRQVIVLAREKDRTKTKEDRTVELCPRALSVLKRQLALREQYLQAGKIDHDFVFFKDDGEPIRSLKYPYMRWRYVMEKFGLRYRDPYTARHSCVSWHLMLGKNLMWCARQHGHSVPVMLSNYGTWIENATDADVEEIKRSLASEPTGAKVTATAAVPSATPEAPGFASNSPVEESWGRLSWRKTKYFNSLTGGADGTRTRDPRRDRPVF